MLSRNRPRHRNLNIFLINTMQKDGPKVSRLFDLTKLIVESNS